MSISPSSSRTIVFLQAHRFTARVTSVVLAVLISPACRPIRFVLCALAITATVLTPNTPVGYVEYTMLATLVLLLVGGDLIAAQSARSNLVYAERTAAMVVTYQDAYIVKVTPSPHYATASVEMAFSKCSIEPLDADGNTVIHEFDQRELGLVLNGLQLDAIPMEALPYHGSGYDLAGTVTSYFHLETGLSRDAQLRSRQGSVQPQHVVVDLPGWQHQLVCAGAW